MSNFEVQDIYNALPANYKDAPALINAIRNSIGGEFKSLVPEATPNNSNIVGEAINSTKWHRNNFLEQLIDRIGMVILRNIKLENPFKPFKKGEMPQGYTIEKIFVDLIEASDYNPDVAEQEVFKQNKPDVHAFYHHRNREQFYKQTVRDADLKSAFISWGKFNDFISSLLSAPYNSAEVDEYKWMKSLIDGYWDLGYFKVIEVPDPKDEQSTKNATKKMRATAKRMTLGQGSREWNHAGVHTVTKPKDLFVIIDADFEAEQDVDVLAAAFNMNKAEFLGNKVVIEGFKTTGLKAILVDRNWFMVYDNLFQMESIRNTEGLYTNYTLHVWQTISCSTLENAVAFVTEGTPQPKPEKEIVVSPSVANVNKGATKQFVAEVKEKTGDGMHSLPEEVVFTWAVEGGKVAETKVDANGLLTVGAEETATDLLVTAKGTVDGKELTGIASVKVTS
ncbi:major head protein [Bacillus phage VMY22]|uniref:Major capsid protein n=1 Tax=Bacillus phage VMY22 TaxID=1734382 RepID=A0A0N9ST32_9CAUD|nr:major head protein [Bacillus phage VMY22]ALH46478.1 major capsid protein [Bacillus phage VMY22]